MKVSTFNCNDCANICCVYGVDIDKLELTKIHLFISEHEEEFEAYEECFYEEIPGGYKIKHVKLPENYTQPECCPEWFPKTRCIFSEQDKFCKLQRLCIKYGLDPWSVKPKICWLWPVIYNREDNTISGIGNTGPIDNINRRHESACMCSKLDENGIEWQEKYKEEIAYFNTHKDD